MDNDGRDSAPSLLTSEEKAELLRIGRWGDRTTPMEWGDLCRAVKAARGGLYPADWPEAVVHGHLFKAAGHELKDGMFISTENIEGVSKSVKPHGCIYEQLVYVHGLVSEEGKALNNRGGRVCELAPRKRDGRIGVQMLTSPDVRLWMKPENLFFVSDKDVLDSAPELRDLPDAERLDMGIYLFASDGSIPVPGRKTSPKRAAKQPSSPSSPPSVPGEGSSSSAAGPS